MNWQDALTYPGTVPGRTGYLCNILQDMIPFPNNISDRYVAWSVWLESAVTAGLLTRGEMSTCRMDLATNI